MENVLNPGICLGMELMFIPEESLGCVAVLSYIKDFKVLEDFQTAVILILLEKIAALCLTSLKTSDVSP